MNIYLPPLPLALLPTLHEFTQVYVGWVCQIFAGKWIQCANVSSEYTCEYVYPIYVYICVCKNIHIYVYVCIYICM